jgi:hypothetical protein
MLIDAVEAHVFRIRRIEQSGGCVSKLATCQKHRISKLGCGQVNGMPVFIEFIDLSIRSASAVIILQSQSAWVFVRFFKIGVKRFDELRGLIRGVGPV